jgi:alpha-tubulin suppressor-like RCC1 family protein
MTAIGAGYVHSLAVKSDGTVWVWGDNSQFELGVNSPSASNQAIQTPGLSGIVAVAGGYLSSIALKSDGTVWAWGYDAQGQLGVDPATLPDPLHPRSSTPTPVAGLSGIVAIAAGIYQGLALGSDGTVWTWGLTGLGVAGSSPGTAFTPVAVPGLPPAKAIAGGYGFSLALGQDGRVYGWGGNANGELALEPTGAVTAPLQITH